MMKPLFFIIYFYITNIARMKLITFNFLNKVSLRVIFYQEK